MCYHVYYPDREPIIDPKEFINYYNRCYYLFSSKDAEESIENLLEPDHNLTRDDVMLILRWKFGRIVPVQYAVTRADLSYKPKDYDHNSRNNILRDSITYNGRGKEVNAESICELIETKYAGRNSEYKEVYCELVKKDAKNLGPVYLLTLVSFISRGEYPIYDKYAIRALEAMKKGIVPGQSVKFDSSKHIEDFGKTDTDDIMMQYDKYGRELTEMDKFFGTNHKKSRDLDRALWVYGQLFGVK